MPEKNEFETKLRNRLEELRQYLQGHGGDLEVVAIKDKLVTLRLSGACGCCPHAMVTLKNGIEETLRQELDPEIVVERAE